VARGALSQVRTALGRCLAACLALSIVGAACGGAATPLPTARPPSPPLITPPNILGTAAPSPATPAALSAEQRAAILDKHVGRLIDQVDPAKLDAHMQALVAAGSRDPRHPGHAKAVAYIKEQLGKIGGVRIETHRAVYQGIPLENVFGIIDPPDASPPSGWVMIAAHYDSIAVRTAGWRPAVDPAPGADDNATGTAALLESARIIAGGRSTVSTPSLPFLRQRIVLAFFDGEELFFKGSAAYVQSLPKPYPYAAVVNIDMVGFNPVADRLDLIWYGPQSDKLRDRVKAVNAKYETGITPLFEVFANDGSQYIVDSAPFGLAGIPAVSLVERYGDPDATYPGNTFFHTVNDTPDKITNKRLWLKAAKLTLAVALDLARDS
jgi:Zn-dependent M28 family amino/carboxypeptidase